MRINRAKQAPFLLRQPIAASRRRLLRAARPGDGNCRLTAFFNQTSSGAVYKEGMLFLLNDRILDFNPRDYPQPLDAVRFHSLSLPFVIKLGQEIFSESPLLHREEPERAKRLAMLLAAKAPEVNAALFSAPAVGCRPDQVASRLANLSIEVMAALYAQDQQGGLTPVAADREVWRRMAA